jgi:hypothetical protein
MHLPQAYRSLPRPSSLIKPSHPPTGVFAPVQVHNPIVVVFLRFLSKVLWLYANEFHVLPLANHILLSKMMLLLININQRSYYQLYT